MGRLSDNPLSDLNVLVVEDELLVARALEIFLLTQDVRTVCLATSLEAARASLLRERFDLAILDVRLPDGESYALSDIINGLRLPVVVHSGHADETAKVRFPDAVMCPKPASFAELSAALICALAQRPPLHDGALFAEAPARISPPRRAASLEEFFLSD